MPQGQSDTLDSYEKLGFIEQQPGTTIFRECTINVAADHGQLAAGDGSQIGGQGEKSVLAGDSSAVAMDDSAASSGTRSQNTAAVNRSYRKRWRRSAAAMILSVVAVVVAAVTTVALILGWTDAAIGGYAIAVAALLLSGFSPLISSGD